jgi:hypothetical protein
VRATGEEWRQRAGADWELRRVRSGWEGYRPRRRDRALLTIGEAYALCPGPDPVTPESGIAHVGARGRLPTPGHARRGVQIGVSDVDPKRVIHAPRDVFAHHLLMTGRSGSGKSTLAGSMTVGAMDEIAATGPENRGLIVVIDPHSGLARDVVGRVPAPLADRTAYLDLTARDRLPTLNLLDVAVYPDLARQVERSGILLRLAYPEESWGPRQAAIQRRAATALMSHNRALVRDQQHTILDIPNFLYNDDLRADVLDALPDDLVNEWRDRYGRLASNRWVEWCQPVDNKIYPLFANPYTRHILGTSRSTIESALHSEDCDIVIVDGGSAALGRDAAAFICGAIANLVIQDMLSGIESRPVMLVVDEAAVLAAIDYTTAYPQGRKYGLTIHAAAQSLQQLDSIEPGLSALICSNVGAVVSFGAGSDDASRLAREMDVPARDLVALDEYRAIARWSEGGTKGQAFTLRTLPPQEDSAGALARVEYIRERSLDLYTLPVQRDLGDPAQRGVAR